MEEKKIEVSGEMASEVINGVGEFVGEDLERFNDPNFKVSKSTYTNNLGAAMVLFENMVDNYGKVCLDDIKVAARYLLIVIAARWDTINFRKAKKELGIDELIKKYPWN